MNIREAPFLEIHNEYIVITFDTKQIFRATFDHWDHYDNDYILEENYTFYAIPGRNYQHNRYNNYFTHNNTKFIFNERDSYYHVEVFICEIKRRAEKARQQMEERALDKILKNLVNEEFQWF